MTLLQRLHNVIFYITKWQRCLNGHVFAGTDTINPGTTLDRYENIPSIPVNPPLYSQVDPMHDRGPSMTSTPTVKQAGGTVDPK